MADGINFSLSLKAEDDQSTARLCLSSKTGREREFFLSQPIGQVKRLVMEWGLGCFPGGAVLKNLPTNAGDARDLGSIPGLGRSPGEEMATHSSILAWKIPWTEDSGWLQSMRSQRVGHD